jgi:drug/metabolite transporter (DMT)-like permease
MSFSAIFIKLSHAPGIISSFYRMVIGTSVLIVPFLFHLRKTKKKLPLKGILLAVLAGICFGIDMSFWSTGIVVSKNATIPTIFANTSPIWVGLGSLFFFREKHKAFFWIGILLAFSGIILLIHDDLSSTNGIVFGALMGLSAGLFYSIFILISQPGRQLMDTLSFLFISTFSSAVVLLVSALIFGYSFTGYGNFTTGIFIAYGIFGQVFAWFLVNYSQGHLPASLISPTLLGQPLGTAFLAILILNEYLTVWHISGGIVIISGIYLVHFARRLR